MVIAEQRIGDIETTYDSDTSESSSETRHIVFEAPYSNSYKGKVMLIKSITDQDSHSGLHHYIFKEGDYWIDDWKIIRSKSVKIETKGKVRFFIKNLTTDITGNFSMGNTNGNCNEVNNSFYMYSYSNLHLKNTGTSVVTHGYIYSKGTITLDAGSHALNGGAFTSDGTLEIKGGTGDFGACPNMTKTDPDDDDTFFDECPYVPPSYLTGPFDAWDNDPENTNETFQIVRGDTTGDGLIDDKNISTKLVNNTFQLKIYFRYW